MSVSRSIPFITLEGAKVLAAAAEAEALKRGWTVAIAVVDPTGGLVLLHVLDGTQPASQDIAIEKARTAARFKRPTKAMEDALAGWADWPAVGEQVRPDARGRRADDA